jgi:DNA protecting protein DprA
MSNDLEILKSDNEMHSRVRLFSAIEGGSTFWSSEIESKGAEQVLSDALDGIYDPVKYARTIEKIQKSNADQLLQSIHDAGAVFLIPTDPNWPQSVNDLTAPPIGLVIKGEPAFLSRDSLAIVGSRNPTQYGLRIAQDFAAGFVDREWAITSGGAYGIDAAAHKGALIAEGITVAVIATGIDINYPAGHARLFAEIAELGCLVSEVAPGTSAVPARFLVRNRIIAALSNATLVVEAAFRSGSLRTARDAAELMRPVMAIPGPITSPVSEGCHRLIGERAAEIVTSVADAVEFLSPI